MLAVAALDLAHTRDQVPPVPPQGSPTSDYIERTNRGLELSDELDARAAIYSGLVIAAIAVATGFSLRSRPREQWSRVFANLGIAGVCSLVAVTLLVIANDEDLVAIPGWPAYAPVIAMLAAAGIGALGWRERPADRTSSPRFAAALRWLGLTVIVLTAVTVALAIAYADAQPGCDFEFHAADWTHPVGTIAVITGIAAMALAIVALIGRRWFIALIGIAIPPVAGFAMAISTGALC